MVYNEKSILVSKETHAKLKEVSVKTGIKIKYLVESSIDFYLRHLSYKETEDE